MSRTFGVQQGKVLEQQHESKALTQLDAKPPAALYCLGVLLLPILAVPLCILLGCSNFFLHHGASIWVQSNDAIFDLHDRRCDVLIYGDSTAMTGIDPDLVSLDTGLRTCNISVTNAVLAVTGNLTLDTYLQQNERPRVLLVQLSPDDFQQQNRVWHHTIYAEGMLELLRHGQPEQARQLLLQHPHEAIAFAGYAAGYTAYYAIKDVWFRTTHLRPEEDQVQMRNGFFTPPSPARTTCDRSTSIAADRNTAFASNLAREFQASYGTEGTLVLVDVAPIPSCADNLVAYRHRLAGVTANHLQGLPIGLFNDGRHYTAIGSRVVSTLVARQLNELAQQNPSLDDHPRALPSIASLRTINARP